MPETRDYRTTTRTLLSIYYKMYNGVYSNAECTLDAQKETHVFLSLILISTQDKEKIKIKVYPTRDLL